MPPPIHTNSNLIGCWSPPDEDYPLGQFGLYTNSPLPAREAKIMLCGNCMYLYSFGGDNLVRGVKEFTNMLSLVSTDPEAYQNIVDEIWVNTAFAIHLYCETSGMSWDDIRQIFFDMTNLFNKNHNWGYIVDDLSRILGVSHNWGWLFTVAMIDNTCGSSLVHNMKGTFNNESLVDDLTIAFNQYMAKQSINIQNDYTLKFEFSYTPSLQLDRVDYRSRISSDTNYIAI
jgi:hypothetical protein